MSCLTLRNRKSTETVRKLARTSRRYWDDLSFLRLDLNEPPDTQYAVVEAHCSVIIFGVDDCDWIGYKFMNSFGEDIRDGNDVEEYESDDDDDEIYQDLFAGGGSYIVPDSDDQIWDPRTYFLHAVALRVEVMTKEYTYVVQHIEHKSIIWVSVSY
jgi:hypothetical protein